MARLRGFYEACGCLFSDVCRPAALPVRISNHLYSTKKLQQNADPTAAATSAQSNLIPQLTAEGIYKRQGLLMNKYRGMDGKPVFPGKYKTFRLEQGDKVRTGMTVCMQKRLYYHPGLYVGLGRDLTLYSYENGMVYITWEKVNCNWEKWHIQQYYRDEKDVNIYKPYYHVIPEPQHNRFKLIFPGFSMSPHLLRADIKHVKPPYDPEHYSVLSEDHEGHSKIFNCVTLST